MLQVDNAYSEFDGKVVVDLGCGTVSLDIEHVDAFVHSCCLRCPPGLVPHTPSTFAAANCHIPSLNANCTAS